MTKHAHEGELQRMVFRLNARTQLDAFEAAKFLYDKADSRLASPLIRVLKRGRKPFNRAAAAYVMQVVATPRTIAALERTVNDTAESSRVRGEAAESLAHAHRRE